MHLGYKEYSNVAFFIHDTQLNTDGRESKQYIQMAPSLEIWAEPHGIQTSHQQHYVMILYIYSRNFDINNTYIKNGDDCCSSVLSVECDIKKTKKDFR